jgi:hypothetical protein
MAKPSTHINLYLMGLGDAGRVAINCNMHAPIASSCLPVHANHNENCHKPLLLRTCRGRFSYRSKPWPDQFNDWCCSLLEQAINQSSSMVPQQGHGYYD